MKVLVIHSTGKTAIGDIEANLEQLQGIVGGYIEIFGTGNWHGYCNEEGKLHGLPVNTVATEFAKAIGWPADDVLVGNVVFLGNGYAGEEADVPQWLLDEFTFYMGG